MHQYKSILFYGFVVFAMFFGSGNLVMPLQIGFASGNNWIIGFLGLMLGGIILPFLGFLVIKLYKGSYSDFFGEAGMVAKLFLPLFILSLMGPFGVAPRCITVAHGGVNYLMPDASLFGFSLLFSIITFFLCLKDKVMVKILGKYLSPIKLLTLIILIAAGAMKAPSLLQETNAIDAFDSSVHTSYQTMDLFAAFFFSALIFKQIQDFLPVGTSDRDVLKFSIKAGVVGFLLLGAIYLGLVFLSSHYAFLLKDMSPKLMLPAIAMHTMGSSATIFIACAMFFSCLATAVALNNIYARYICDILKLKDERFPIALFATVATSFAMSLLDFGGIAAILIPVLEASYPGLIALTIMGIAFRKPHKIKMYMFWIITILTVYNTFM